MTSNSIINFILNNPDFEHHLHLSVAELRNALSTNPTDTSTDEKPKSRFHDLTQGLDDEQKKKTLEVLEKILADTQKKKCTIFEAIVEITVQLTEMPYNPVHWSLRASLLLEIGYPELAAGDARKSQKLSTAMLSGEGVGIAARAEPVYFGKSVEELHLEAFGILARALNEAGAFVNLREMCLEARALYSADNIFTAEFETSAARIKELKNEQRRRAMSYPHVARQNLLGATEILQFGFVDFRRYPFMPLEYLHRNAALFEATNTTILAMTPVSVQPSNVVTNSG
ncbi:uncharacterized protein LY89DRAFT_783087 [Mollisia scopiformis]|uniref:Uncharacterized protein n=1 Tax=Mollisia scopiformis TaxID=149040 RepID=A0A194X6M5_MOLSC|nr:uncharacterized protein LY89DRAFT_783087 [Mollisia scopiformis]KUJ15818.1 hypothetical protein LY89DRAFT_783087 [Mollisia scopiformis]